MMASSNPDRSRYNLLAFGSMGVVGVFAVAALLLLHHNLVTAVLLGFAWALVSQGIAWGVAELVVPGWVLKWRARLIAGTTDWRKPVGEYFSQKFEATGAEPWTNPQAIKRIRLLGMGLTTVWLMIVGLLLWMPPILDKLYGTFSGHA
jgi:hypothetical protein